MKLMACFSVFNGLELLNQSITNIIDDVDSVLLCVSRANHYGVPNDAAWQYVQPWGKHKKISIVSFIPSDGISSKQNEIVKHQLMIDIALGMEMSHFLLMAEDHFYLPGEFRKMKSAVEYFNLDASFTHMFTYYKKPTWRLDPIENYSAPFICKTKKGLRIAYDRNFPIKTDPSVQISPLGNWHWFDPKNIMLHHMSMIRENISDKFNSFHIWQIIPFGNVHI